MKGLNAALGWILMLAVLAVPSFLFYNWWSKNKIQSAYDTPVGASVKDVFASAGRNSSSGQPASSALPESAVGISLVSAASAGEAVAHASSAPIKAELDALKSEASRGERLSYFSPKKNRNPMLSPEDHRRLREAELRRLEQQKNQRLQQEKREKDAGIESKIKLQGIMGNTAIINGEMYIAGQSIYGGKIVKVGSNYIIGEYKGKRFRKVMR